MIKVLHLLLLLLLVKSIQTKRAGAALNRDALWIVWTELDFLQVEVPISDRPSCELFQYFLESHRFSLNSPKLMSRKGILLRYLKSIHSSNVSISLILAAILRLYLFIPLKTCEAILISFVVSLIVSSSF